MSLERLKTETRELHELVERNMDLDKRLASIDCYVQMLKRLYGFYGPLELSFRLFDGLAMALTDLSQRMKVPLLELDLRHLGLNEMALDEVPRCTHLPTLSSIEQALGCVYVVEGATLGGQIISRQVAARLGVLPERGGAFFACYASQVGPMWQRFRQALQSRLGSDVAQWDECIQGAKDAFWAFDRWLSIEEAQPQALA